MAAPQGNQNAIKKKPWTDAIRRAIARHDMNKEENAQFLNVLANQLINDCLEGDKLAREELVNRLEGKVAQQNILTGDSDNPVAIAEIRRVVIDGNPNP